MTEQKEIKLRDVFGVAREIPANYIEREAVDKKFIDSLSRDKHVVIYGSSKQGKTTLRKYCLKETDYIVINCSNTMSLSMLNAAILKSAGYRIEQSQVKSSSGTNKYTAEFTGEGGVPFVSKISGKGAVGRDEVEKSDLTSKKLEIELEDVNDIIISLKEISFEKYIVIEDFHYLPIDVQRAFSFSLKSYHESSKLCFIIIGVWREKNRIIYYNGDLTDRVSSIDVDEWKQEDLRKVASVGFDVLNISVKDSLIDEIVDKASGSVNLVQEVCHSICEISGISERKSTRFVVSQEFDIDEITRKIVSEQAGRYQSFINNFSEGFQQTELEMYKWLVSAILKSSIDELGLGLRRNQISRAIKSIHPEKDKLNEGNVTQALQNAASLQVQKSIRPIIFDYDQTTRVLTVVDRSFLIWLRYQNIEDLLSEIGVN
jgi:hypothetical protein